MSIVDHPHIGSPTVPALFYLHSVIFTTPFAIELATTTSDGCHAVYSGCSYWSFTSTGLLLSFVAPFLLHYKGGAYFVIFFKTPHVSSLDMLTKAILVLVLLSLGFVQAAPPPHAREYFQNFEP